MEAHEVLGISADASEDCVRAAFKVLALKWHPDRHPVYSRDEATTRFVEINKANRTMLRNIRRSHRSAPSSQASNASTSSPSSPEASSTSLPDECAASCSGSECSSSRASESTQSLASSFSSRSPSPSHLPTKDEPQARSSSPDWARTTDRMTGNSSSYTTQKPTRSRVRGQSSSTNRKQDPITENGTPKCLHQGSIQAHHGPERQGETLHPVRSSLRGAGTDAPKRWTHVLNMSLEDLYSGKTFYFRVVRYRRSGRKTIVPLEVYVPPGSSAGTEIIVEGVGNERKDGTMQSIVFLMKEVGHEVFTRMQEDLLMEVRLPWVDSLNERSGRVHFQSIDGQEYMFNVDYHMDGLLSGTTVVPDAGMPFPDRPGRGRVVIRWEISSPKSSWGTLKQILKFKG